MFGAARKKAIASLVHSTDRFRDAFGAARARGTPSIGDTMRYTLGATATLGTARRRSSVVSVMALLLSLTLWAAPAKAMTRNSGSGKVPFPPPTHQLDEYAEVRTTNSLLLNDALQAADCGGELLAEAGYAPDTFALSTYEWGSSLADYSCTGSRYVTSVEYRTAIVDNGAVPMSVSWTVDRNEPFASQDVPFVGSEPLDIHGQGSLIVWFFSATVTLSDGASTKACGYAWTEQGGPVAVEPTDCDSGDEVLILLR
jgi:hypothetical protein